MKWVSTKLHQTELEKNLPFLFHRTDGIRQAWRGREDAHHAIREHTLNPGTLESSEISGWTARRLGEDVRVPLPRNFDLGPA